MADEPAGASTAAGSSPGSHPGAVRPPTGEIGAKRDLHLFYLVDCSGSMAGQKIQSLNFAIRSTIIPLRVEAQKNPNAQLYVRVICFSSSAQWIAPGPTPIEEFEWTDLRAGGETQMGEALWLLAEELRNLEGQRLLPPIIILVTDGQPTDDYASGLRKLLSNEFGEQAVRIGIAIGDDCKDETLTKFISNPEIRPLRANNPDELVSYIRWASTAVTSSVSRPMSQTGSAAHGGITAPVPPEGSSEVVF